ncbi:MAG: hypothetical protein ACPG4N_03760, partial [Gammaproteobacteria bacterium]
GQGRRAVSASDDGTLRVWDLELGVQMAIFTADAAVSPIAIIEDGPRFIAGDRAGRIHYLEYIEPDQQ